MLNGIKRFFLNPSKFRITYLLTLFFTNVILIRSAAVIVQYVLMLWAALIIYFYYIRNGRILKIKYVHYLLLYLVSITITALLNITSNFWLNMLMAAHIAICFFVFYGMHTEKNKKRIYREIFLLAGAVILITFLLNLAAFPLACLNIHFKWTEYSVIIYENRFTGFFINPNLLGFMSAVSIIFAHFLKKPSFIQRACAKAPPKWILYAVSIFNLICMFLSDSNASFVFLLFYIASYSFFAIFKKRTEFSFKQIAIKSLKFISCIVAASVLMILARMATGYTVSQLAARTEVKLPSSVTQPLPVPDVNNNPEDPPVSFKHQNENLDSGRIRLLMESAVLIKNYPLFGTGKANLVPYSQQYIEGGLHFSDLHNGYLTIIVCSGIVGFIIFIGFAIHLARHMIKSLFLEEMDLRRTIFPCLFSFIFSYCIYSCFEKTILYEQSFMVVIFWAILGYASLYMLKYDHLQDHIKFKTKNKREDKTEEYDAPSDVEVSN